TIFFTSDNGGIPSRISPLNGSKGSLYEGGIKVPAAAWGYGVKKSSDSCSEIILGMDFYPTIIELTGLSHDPSHKPDGISLVPHLRGNPSINRGNVFWHFPCYIGKGEPSSVIRNGRYKLIYFFEDKRSELYDLEKDPNEKNDLASSKVVEKQRMENELFAWLKKTGAAVPSGPNPSYDPTVVSKGKKGKEGKGKKSEPGNKGSKEDEVKRKKKKQR
ncbi:MAG: DUF4976 domain-containing protein, partial [Opitutae bacterium]|nr:DUF4976 domain-containing protein [Opitutae bacterium]